MNEMNFYTLNGEQYEVADKANREEVKKATQEIAKKADLDYLNRNFAPAIPVTMSGTAVSTDMVSPIVHEAACKVRSINLLPEQPEVVTKFKVIPIKLAPGTYTVSAKTIKTDAKISMVSVFFKGGNHDVGNATIKFAETQTATVTLKEPADSVQFVSYYTYTENQNNVSTWTDVQIQKGSVATPYTPYISDLAEVAVTRCGKNLVNEWNVGKVPYGPNGTLVGRNYACGTTGLIPVNTKYSYTFSTARGDNKSSYEMWAYDIKRDLLGSLSSENTTTKLFEKYPLVKYIRGVVVYTLTRNPQMEIGNEITNYEAYNGKNFTPNSEGVVSSIISVSPSMTIFTNNPNAAIEATYNADTKKYIDKKFAELRSAILSTGGNV